MTSVIWLERILRESHLLVMLLIVLLILVSSGAAG